MSINYSESEFQKDSEKIKTIVNKIINDDENQKLNEQQEKNNEKNYDNKNTMKNRIKKLRKFIIDFLKFLEIKIFGLLMICLGAFIIYYTNIIKVLFSDDRVNLGFLFICLAGYTVCISIIIYLSFYLPLVKKINEDSSIMKENDDKFIPIMSGIGFFSMLSFVISVYNIYGIIFSFVIIISIKFGILFCVNILLLEF